LAKEKEPQALTRCERISETGSGAAQAARFFKILAQSSGQLAPHRFK
jgi:hypothetical protein